MKNFKPTFNNVLLRIEDMKSDLIVEEKETTKKLLFVEDIGPEVKAFKKGQRIWLGAISRPQELKVEDEIFIIVSDREIIASSK